MALVSLHSKFRSDVFHHVLVGGKRQLEQLNLVSPWFEWLDSSIPLDAVSLQQECLGDRTDLWCFTELLLLVLTYFRGLLTDLTCFWTSVHMVTIFLSAAPLD